jgi:hypothetical protein
MGEPAGPAVKTSVRRLRIERLRRDFQPEENLIPFVVDEYVAILTARRPAEPVTVRYDGKTYWLQDGYHRVAAAEKLRWKTVTAEVIAGSFADMEDEFKQMVAAIRENLKA